MTDFEKDNEFLVQMRIEEVTDPETKEALRLLFNLVVSTREKLDTNV